MKEVSFIFNIHDTKPEVYCKFSEDNQSCISVADSKTLSPRTKHITIKYHNFQIFVQKKMIWICSIDTQEQTADILTKPLTESLFIYLQRKLSGWRLKK